MELFWKYAGNPDFRKPITVFTPKIGPFIMNPKDFSIFCMLLSDVHNKAFGEPIAKIRHSKALTLAWIIEENTGIALSYKSLTNYVNAVLEENPEKVNPSCLTLAALAQFVTGEKTNKLMPAIWYKYRAVQLKH